MQHHFQAQVSSIRHDRRVLTGLHTLVASLFIITALVVSAAAHAETLRLSGTGTALGTMRLLGEAYKKTDPQFVLEIVPNLGSGGSLKALERDAIQLATIGRPLTAAEAAKGFNVVEYGKTPFVIATARKGTAALALAQIAEIYAGKQARWPDGTPIRLVLRPVSESDTPLLASFSPAIKEGLASAMAREGMITALTDQDSATEISRLPGGLGTSSLALILSEKRPLFPLAIEGVTPSAKSLADGTYPYAKTLYFATYGKASASVTRFIAFVQSAEGRRILADTGHVPTDLSVTRASAR